MKTLTQAINESICNDLCNNGSWQFVVDCLEVFAMTDNINSVFRNKRELGQHCSCLSVPSPPKLGFFLDISYFFFVCLRIFSNRMSSLFVWGSFSTECYHCLFEDLFQLNVIFVCLRVFSTQCHVCLFVCLRIFLNWMPSLFVWGSFSTECHLCLFESLFQLNVTAVCFK